jgi:hypothetical protein
MSIYDNWQKIYIDSDHVTVFTYTSSSGMTSFSNGEKSSPVDQATITLLPDRFLTFRPNPVENSAIFQKDHPLSKYYAKPYLQPTFKQFRK